MTDDGGAYVRTHYGVPARVGTPVMYEAETGRIVGFKDQYIVVKMDEPNGMTYILHPTWRVTYGAPVG